MSEIVDDEAYYDFGFDDCFGDMVFDLTGNPDAATVETILVDDNAKAPVPPKLHTLRYHSGRTQLKKFVSDLTKKPSCVSKMILDGLEDLEDLYDEK